MLAAALFLLSLWQNPGPSVTGTRSLPVTSLITYTGVECDNFSSTATSIACTLTVPSSGTQTLVIYTSVAVGGIISATTTCGTVTTIRSVNWNTVDAETAYAMYVPNATPGSCTITTTMGLSNFPVIMVADFAGANATTPIDNASCTSTPFCSGTGTGGGIINGTITTANPGEMVIGMAENYSVGTMPTTIGGFTQIPGGASSYYAMNYTPATGSYVPSFTGASPWVAMAIALTT